MNKDFIEKLTLVLFLALFIAQSTYAEDNKYLYTIVNERFDSIAAIINEKDYNGQLNNENTDNLSVAQLKDIAGQEKDSILTARSIYWEIRTSQLAAQPDSCIKKLEKALGMINGKYEYDRARVQYQLAGNYERMNQLFKSYQLLISAIPVFEKMKDYYYLGNAYYLMALIFRGIEDAKSANEYIRLSQENYGKAKAPLNKIYFFKALLADGDEAIRLYNMTIKEDENEIGTVSQAYCNMASIYIEKGMTDSARICIDKGLKSLEKLRPENRLLHSILLINVVRINYINGEYHTALENLKKIQNMSKDYPNERYIVTMYMLFSEVYEKLGNITEAYEYLKLYQTEFARQMQISEQEQIQRMRAKEAINKQNATINLLKKEAEIRQNYIYITILVSIVFILIVSGISIVLYMRMRIRKIENRELRNNLKQEMIIASINRQNFENDIQQKNCEISSSVLLLANKNEVLQQISDITRKYSDNGQIPAAYVKQINEVIGLSLKNDDEWSRFKIHFDSVHPSFFTKLKEACSELTENDLRLCAYIRIGMRAKQIAEMLSVSPDSVNSNRYRLRKKLNLKKEDSLDDFIRKI